MKFDYIKLTNYRQYRRANVDLSHITEDKNFVIIIGTTGAGKTNFLNAITWCLYGIEYNIRDKNKALPLINLTTFGEMNEGDISEVSVEIQMQDDENKKILMRRTLAFKKVDGKPVVIPNYRSKAPDKSTFVLLRPIGRDMKPVDSPEFVLNSMIPQSIEEYFFFDGERLNEYFTDTPTVSLQKIREAVFKISQIDLLSNLITHLSKRKDDRLRILSKSSPKAKQVQESLDMWKKSKETQIEELNRLRPNRDKTKKKIKEFSDHLKKSKVVNVRQLEQERLELIEDVKRLGERIEGLEKQKLQFLVESTPWICLKDPLSSLYELIKQRDEAGKIPPEYEKGFIERLLRDEKCICGTDLKKHSKCKQRLKTVLDEHDVLDQLSVFLIKLGGSMNRIQSDLKKFDDKRIEYGQNIRSFEVERKKNSERIKEIAETIKGVDVEQVRYWQNKLQEWSKEKEKIDQQITIKEYQLKEYDKRISVLERTLEKELRKEDKSRQLELSYEFSKEALDVAQGIKSEIMIEIKEEIEEKTREQFFSLIWKSSDYKDVKISNQYDVSVIHRSGLEGLGTLSHGEGAVLALSFMAALNNVSGFNVPIVIDTPLGRIAGVPRKKIARNLPRYLPGKQVTMLVTDTEYTDEVKALLSKRVGITYQIDFIETEHGGLAKVVRIE